MWLSTPSLSDLLDLSALISFSLKNRMYPYSHDVKKFKNDVANHLSSLGKWEPMFSEGAGLKV